MVLWDPLVLDFRPSRLPPSSDDRVRRFFASRAAHARSSYEWFEICAGHSHLKYLSRVGAERFELHPAVDDFVAALGSLLGTSITTPTPKLVSPLWSGCSIGWELTGTPSRPVLLLRPLDSADSAEPTTVGIDGTSRRLRCNAIESGRAPANERLRVVFTPGVHCYVLRSLVCDEPAWLDGCRRLWLDRWRASCKELSQPLCSPAVLTPTHMELPLGMLLGRQLLLAQAHELR